MRWWVAGALALALLAGLAPPSPAADPEDFLEEEISDPIEPVNRVFFDINEFLDRTFLRPVSKVYRAVVPEPARESVHNFMRNLGTPVVLVNDLFQGEGERAETTLARFMINTTIGIGGLFDVADRMGYPYHKEDFGQTLAVYGVDEGFYLVLPLLGPSTLRDSVGMALDGVLNPLNYMTAANGAGVLLYGVRGVGAVDEHARSVKEIDQLKNESVDYYSLIKSLYEQYRREQIRNGKDTMELQVNSNGKEKVVAGSEEEPVPDSFPEFDGPISDPS